MTKAKKRSIVFSLMVAMFLGAVEGTVVTTAMPTIARELSGFSYISMVFSAYLLTSAISTPIYGKLSDLYGRKHILSIGIGLFLVGSALCGLSSSMMMLIAFRAVQGLGAGAIFTVTYTIVGDLFPLEERPKVQGILGTVWGVASLVGPFLGGVLIDSFSWRFIFYINLPFGLLSIFLLEKNLEEVFEKKKHAIDIKGIAILSLGIVILLNAFDGIITFGLPKNIFLFGSVMLTILLCFFFYKIEQKEKEPIISFDIFTKSNIYVSLISFFISAILISMDVYLPIYIQNILGYSPKISGLSLAPMSISWILSAFILGKGILRYGAKAMILLSNSIMLVGVLLLFTLGMKSSLLLVLIFTFLLGFAFGGAFTTLTIMVQESVGILQRGSAVATNSLIRTIGQTIGISIFGGIFNHSILLFFQKRNIQGVNPDNLYKSGAHAVKISALQIKESLNQSLHMIFILLIGLTAISIVLTVLLPGLKKVGTEEVSCYNKEM